MAGPLILALREFQVSGLILAALIVLAILSDIFDGIIARRLGTDTALLRRADSVVDLLFWVCLAIACFRGYRAELMLNVVPISLLLFLDLSRIVFDAIKFRNYAAYHSYFSKGWALALTVATVALLGFGQGGWVLTSALLIGIVGELEGWIISLILPRAHVDVHTVAEAWRMRKGDLGV